MDDFDKLQIILKKKIEELAMMPNCWVNWAPFTITCFLHWKVPSTYQTCFLAFANEENNYDGNNCGWNIILLSNSARLWNFLQKFIRIANDG